MKKCLTIALALMMLFALVFSASAEAQKVLELDFSEASSDMADSQAQSQGEAKVADGRLAISGWRPGSTTSAGYVKTKGVLPAPNHQMGTMTLQFEFVPQDVSWTIAKVLIGAKDNGTEQDALVLEIYGNDFAMEKRGMFKLNMGGVVTDLGEFNTGELIADATYVIWLYKDNSTGTVDFYFYDKDSKVPAEPVLTVQADDMKGIIGNVAFTSYAGRYTVDNLVVYDGEAPRPTAPPTKTPTEKTPTSQTDSSTKAPSGTTDSTEAVTPTGESTTTGETVTDPDTQDGNRTTLIVILCIAGAVIIGAAVAIILVYRSSMKKAQENTEENTKEE